VCCVTFHATAEIKQFRPLETENLFHFIIAVLFQLCGHHNENESLQNKTNIVVCMVSDSESVEDQEILKVGPRGGGGRPYQPRRHLSQMHTTN